VKRGQSVDVVADVFSQALLPHDFLLYGGVPKLGARSPSDLSAPANLITVTFSQQQVNNGDGVVVTFSAASESTTGPYSMVIRSRARRHGADRLQRLARDRVGGVSPASRAAEVRGPQLGCG